MKPKTNIQSKITRQAKKQKNMTHNQTEDIGRSRPGGGANDGIAGKDVKTYYKYTQFVQGSKEHKHVKERNGSEEDPHQTSSNKLKPEGV